MTLLLNDEKLNTASFSCIQQLNTAFIQLNEYLLLTYSFSRSKILKTFLIEPNLCLHVNLHEESRTGSKLIITAL